MVIRTNHLEWKEVGGGACRYNSKEGGPGRPQGPRPEAGELVEHWPRKEGFQEEAKASRKASGKPAWHVAGRRGVRTDAETAGGKQSDTP